MTLYNLAHVILFGCFAALSLVAIALFDRRARRQETPVFFERSAVLSLRPLLRADWWRDNIGSVSIRAAIALLLWAGVLHGHAALFGASPLPL